MLPIDHFLLTDAVQIHALKNKTILRKLQTIVKEHFTQSVDEYLQLSNDDYREIVLQAQSHINDYLFHHKLVQSELDTIQKIMGPNISLSSLCYLRATRPHQNQNQETITWHRESFFGGEMMKSCINIWMPIMNVSESNSLQIIPDSHKIPAKDIVLKKKLEDSTVERFSVGHKIGLLYSPPYISEGVDFAKAIRLKVSEGEYALFSGHIVHGGAINLSSQIRYSLDFRIIPNERILKNDYHFAADTVYWSDFQPQIELS